MSDLIDRWAVVDAIKDADVCVCYPENESVEIENVIDLAIRATKGSVIASIEQLPSAQPERRDSHENDKVFVDKDAYEQCRFEYINACKITHNRTPDTRQSDINDAYAVIKALHPIFGEESFL